MKFLLGPDDQVEKPKRRLQLGSDFFAFDKAAFAVAMAGDTPEIGAIVDIQRRSCIVLAGKMQRLQHRGLGIGVRQVGASHHHGAGIGDKILVDVILAQCHVGTILAVKDQREAVLVADAQQHKRRQPVGIGLDAAQIHAFTRQFLADEAAHMLVAHTGDQCRFQPKPRGARRHVGRRAADVFLKSPHVFETTADLRAVEVNRRTANGHQIQFLRHSVSPSEPMPSAILLARTVKRRWA